MYLERRFGRWALHSDVARIAYECGMWQRYATELLPPDHFTALLDWNIKPWLDDGTGGGLEAGLRANKSCHVIHPVLVHGIS